MGVFSHSKLYSHKHINAEITDSADRIHVVHIKYVLGDYFVTKIDGQTYVFRLKGKIYTYHALGMRTVRKIYYSTKHYMPISMADYKKIEEMMDINKLPQLDRTLFDTLKYLGKTERKNFKVHDMDTVFQALAKEQNRYQEEAQAMKDFLEHLNIKQIVTPVKEITEFIQGDLIATDPQFFGDVIPAYQRLDTENKKITNTPVRGKGPWMKIIAIVAIIGLIGAIIAIAITEGWFDGVGNLVPQIGTSGGPKTTTDWISQFPTPESIRTAIDNGQIQEASLPKELKDMLSQYKPPTVTPKSNTVNLTP